MIKSPKYSQNENSNSREGLNHFFMDSIRELYCAENIVGETYQKIKDGILSDKLRIILDNHFQIHLNHLERLEKIFKLHNEEPQFKDCESFTALINEAQKHLEFFANDPLNWDIALILTAQKLAHYKIAAYSASSHLAINLNLCAEATLLAVDVQEEEEFINNYLNELIHEFLKPFQ